MDILSRVETGEFSNGVELIFKFDIFGMIFSASKRINLNLDFERRIITITILFFLFGFLIIFYLFNFQIIQHQFYLNLASKSQEIYRALFPQRGQIFVQDSSGELYPVVSNSDYYLLYAEPKSIKSAKEIIDKITPILGLKEEEWKKILEQINKPNDPYEPLRHKVTEEQMVKISDLNLAGLGFLPESYRYYPEKKFGGQILGFVGYQGSQKKGLYGLEGYFDKELTGLSGMLKSTKDASGALITIGGHEEKKPKDGVNLVLTIDRKIQFNACLELENAIKNYEADSGTVIIMEPQTGAIVSLCNYPDFELENYQNVEDINYFNNPAIFYAYEPGSVFKAITMAAGLDSGAITPETTYVDEGEVKVADFTIRNADLQAHGKTTMTRVLELSLNTGAIFVADKIGRDDFREYIKKFGLGKLTGITLDKEVAGDISPLSKRGQIYTLTASYGQGITVTPIQLITAYAAIANQGKLVKPYIVKETIDGDQKVITQTEIVGQPISQRTASVLSGMLISVVENGWSKKAGIPGYYVAGKTGTAEIPQQGGYAAGKTIHTFVGFAPANQPKFVMLIKLDNVKRVMHAADSAAPIFGKLAKFLLNYYQISPER